MYQKKKNNYSKKLLSIKRIIVLIHSLTFGINKCTIVFIIPAELRVLHVSYLGNYEYIICNSLIITICQRCKYTSKNQMLLKIKDNAVLSTFLHILEQSLPEIKIQNILFNKSLKW